MNVFFSFLTHMMKHAHVAISLGMLRICWYYVFFSTL